MGEEYVIKNAVKSLQKILHYFPIQSAILSEKEWNEKADVNIWSKKEVVGHLVDSAFTNLQRYIRIQYQNTPHIVYDQDAWVKAQHWQELPVTDIIMLWKVVNKQILHIWKNFPQAKINSLLNVSKDKEEMYTFAEMIQDYIDHCKHHIQQILPQMITVIAAVGQNNELGKGNDLIWHLPADLKRFKEVTTGHHIIMGRNTFESIGKPLPNRTTIIITRDKNYAKEGCLTAASIEEAIELAKSDSEIFIIGGAQIYKQVINNYLINRLDITHVHETFDADVFFPEIKSESWKEIAREDFKADDKNKYDYSFVSYLRK